MTIDTDMMFNLLLIFGGRCSDVTMGVFRILMLVRGRKVVAACLGFFEVMIFLLVMGVILGGGKTLTVVEIVAYCSGFAAGNLLGTYLEGKLMEGYVLVEIIAERNSDSELLVKRLRDAGFGTTVLVGEGRNGPRLVIKVICSRKQLNKVRQVSGEYGGFFFVSDIKGVSGGHFAHHKRK